jgi:hypothetical protein
MTSRFKTVQISIALLMGALSTSPTQAIAQSETAAILIADNSSSGLIKRSLLCASVPANAMPDAMVNECFDVMYEKPDFAAHLDRVKEARRQGMSIRPGGSTLADVVTKTKKPEKAKPSQKAKARDADPKLNKLVRFVGMGVGIGKRCQLTYSPLSDGFERMLKRAKFNPLEIIALRAIYRDGEDVGRIGANEPGACPEARRIWRDQLATLTVSMSGVR